MTFNWIPGTSESPYTFQSSLTDARTIQLTLTDTNEIPLSFFTDKIVFHPPGISNSKNAPCA